MRMGIVSKNEMCQGKFSLTVVYNKRERLRVRNLTESFFRVFLKKIDTLESFNVLLTRQKS